MYIVRWLAGHPMIAVWVLGAIAILLSYGSIGKKNHAGEQSVNSNEVSSVVSTTNEELDPTETHKKAVDSESRINDIVSKVELNEEKVSSESTAITAVVEGKSNEGIAPNKVATKLPVSEKKASDVEPTTNQITKEITELASNNPGLATEEIAKENSSQDSRKSKAIETNSNENNLNNTQTEVADLGQLTSEEMLKMAREAYWNNGLDEAAQIYKQLIKVEPKVVEHRGELGNVYWRQGYPKKAAEIYSEIAIPMIESGNANRVANMIGFIGLFYPDRASVIQDRIVNHQNN